MNIIDYMQQRFTQNETFKKIIIYFNYGNNIGMTCLIIIIVFNFTNVYKSFLLFSMVSVCYYLSSLMKFFFQSSTPYLDKENGLFNNKDIKIFFCSLGYGNPSTDTLVIVPFYLSLWKIYHISKPKVNEKFKIFLLIFDIILIVCLWQDGRELYQIIKYKLYIYFVLYCFLFGILFVVYFTVLKSKSNINDKLEGCKVYNSGKVMFLINEKGENHYIKGSFTLIGVFIANFFCIFAIKIELFFFFKGHKKNWIDFNFSQDKFDDDENNGNSITITKDAKWNNTTVFRSLIRLIILLLLSSISLCPYIFISWDNNFYFIFIVKLTLPIIIFEFCLFCWFKRILKNTGFINPTIFATSDEKRILG